MVNPPTFYTVYEEHLDAFQLSSVLIYVTCFTKFRESSNINPNISLTILTSGKAAPSANRGTVRCIFQGSTEIILFSRNHLHSF